MKQHSKALLASVSLFLLILFISMNTVLAARGARRTAGNVNSGDSLLHSFALTAQEAQVTAVGGPVAPGLSRPVRDLPAADPHKPGDTIFAVNPRQPGAFAPGNTEGGLLEQTTPPFAGVSSIQTPNPIRTFEGLSLMDGGSGVPPDTVGDVGPNHYVQMVNSSIGVWDKNGAVLVPQVDINSLWSDGTLCETQNAGDPVVLYDRMADRWMITQFNHTNSSTPPFYQCIAVSQTADPTGSWYTYSFTTTSTTTFNDYGKFGVWPDGYYMGANEGGFTAYVFDRVNMLAGNAARPLQRVNVPGQNMMLPSDLDGPTAPPAGSPNYYYTMLPGNTIDLWAFQVDWDTPGNSSFTRLVALTSSGFDFDVCPADPTNDNSFDCIPQPGTTQTLDAIGEWPMFRFQYRNQGTHESLVGNFTVDTNSAPNVDHAAPHWFELRKNSGSGSWAIQNEGTIAPDTTTHRWMGSAAMDKDGNIAVGYTASNGTDLFPSIRYVTRLASDPAGVMGNEATLWAGSAAQIGSNRWGDYSAMSVDPVDDCTFWYTAEYVENSSHWWQTRIGAFKVPSCGIVFTDFLYLPLVTKP